MIGKKEKFVLKVFWDVIFPFFSIVLFFWVALWNQGVLTWDYRMYMALLLSVLFSFFLQRLLYKVMNVVNNKSLLYELLWEIVIPVLVTFMVVCSLVDEYRFYNLNMLTLKENQGMFYVFIFLGVILVCFLFKGFLLFKKNLTKK